jgi:hypothetical protein
MAAEKETIVFEVKVEDDGAVESIDTLRKSTRELTQQRNALNLATEEGRKKAEVLNKSIDENNKKIKENSSALEKQRTNVGNYSNSIQDAAGKMGIFGNSLGGAASQMQGVTAAAKAFIATPIGAIVAAVAAAVSVAVAALKKFEVVLDVIEDVVTQVTAVFDSLIQNLDKIGYIVGNVLTGNFDEAANATKQLTAEVKAAADESQRLLDLTRQLEEAEISYRLETAASANEIKAYIAQSKNKNNTIEEANALLQKASELEAKSTKQATENAKLKLDIELGLLQASKKRQLEEKGLLEQGAKSYKEYLDEVNRSGIFSKEELENVIAAFEKLESARSGGLALQEKVQNQQDALDQKRLALIQKTLAEEQKLAEFVKKIDEQKATKIDGEIKEIETAELTKLQLKTDFAVLNNEIDQKAIDQDKAFAAEREKIRQAELESERQTNLKKLQYLSTTLSSIRGLFKQSSQAAKVAALVDIGVNTALGFVQGLDIAQKSAKATGPLAAFAFPAFYATQIAAVLGAANQAKEVIKGFASGGLTGTRIGPGMGSPIRRSNGDDMLATVKTGEVILNQSHQARLGGAATFARIGVPGFATSGVTGSFETAAASSQSAQSRIFAELKAAFKSQQIVLPLEDFDIKQATRVQINTTAQVI